MHFNNLKKFYFIDEFNKDHLKNLDNNTAIIYRNYTKKYDKSLIFEIKKFCKSKNLKFFLANDINLAIELRLDGIYIPAFNKKINIIKSKIHNLMSLGSAHNIKEINEKPSLPTVINASPTDSDKALLSALTLSIRLPGELF